MGTSLAGIVGGVLLTLEGYLFPNWLFVFAGMIIALLCSNDKFALLLGVIADLVYGPPTGMLHILPFPFTAFVCLAIVCKIFLLRQMLSSVPEQL